MNEMHDSFKLYKEYMSPDSFIIHNNIKEGSTNFDIQISTLGNSIRSYSLERLNLLFETQFLESQSKGKICFIKQFNEYILYVTGNVIRLFRRGEMIGLFEFETKIVNVLVVNEELLILFKGGCICIYGFNRESNICINNGLRIKSVLNFQDRNFKTLSFVNEIEGCYNNLFHYNKNKIILIEGKRLIIFDIQKLKMIYAHEFNENIEIIDTLNKEICVIGFVNSLLIFNLKTGVNIFEYSIENEVVKKLSFMNFSDYDSSNLLILTNKALRIMDLNTKKIIHENHKIIYSEFIKNTNLFCLITENNSLQIWKIEDKKCCIFKQRNFPISAKFMHLLNKTNILSINNKEIYNLAIYKDEQTYKYTTIDNTNIDSYDIRKDVILLKKGKAVSFLKNKKEYKFIENFKEEILNARLTECGNLICFIFKSRIVVMDSHEMIFNEFKGHFLDIQMTLLNQKIFLMSTNKVTCINLEENILFEKEIRNLKKISLNEILFVEYELKPETLEFNLILLDSKNGNIMRQYESIKSYQLNSNQNKLILLRNSKIEIINLISNKVTQRISKIEKGYDTCRLTQNEDLLYLSGKEVPIRIYRNTGVEEKVYLKKREEINEISWTEKETLLTEILAYCQLKRRDN